MLYRRWHAACAAARRDAPLYAFLLVAGLAMAPGNPGPRAEEAGGTGGAETGRQGADASFVEKESIVIRADRAWEEPDNADVLHFAGNFVLLSPDWELRSDEADLYGELDDPTRIVARGSPALLTLFDEEDRILGEGGEIDYQRHAELLILRENARLTSDELTMKSSEIVWDVAAEQLRSSGEEGVEMVLEAAD